MESYLTRPPLVYVENTEYLQSTFDNVASSLLKLSALLGATGAIFQHSIEFEYCSKMVRPFNRLWINTRKLTKYANSI